MLQLFAVGSSSVGLYKHQAVSTKHWWPDIAISVTQDWVYDRRVKRISWIYSSGIQETCAPPLSSGVMWWGKGENGGWYLMEKRKKENHSLTCYSVSRKVVYCLGLHTFLLIPRWSVPVEAVDTGGRCSYPDALWLYISAWGGKLEKSAECKELETRVQRTRRHPPSPLPAVPSLRTPCSTMTCAVEACKAMLRFVTTRFGFLHTERSRSASARMRFAKFDKINRVVIRMSAPSDCWLRV